MSLKFSICLSSYQQFLRSLVGRHLLLLKLLLDLIIVEIVIMKLSEVWWFFYVVK